MIYKFKSKAAGDLILLGPHGDALLRAMGREPAPQGIVETAALDAAIAALKAAAAAPDPAAESPAADAAPEEAVSLRRRAWPLIEMLERARAAGEPVIWGV